MKDDPNDADLTDNDKLCRSLDGIASALRALGNGNAATQMGAIEALSVEVRKGLETIASAIDGVGEIVRDFD